MDVRRGYVSVKVLVGGRPTRRTAKVFMRRAGNEHLQLTVDRISTWTWRRFTRRLVKDYGFRRAGRPLKGPGQTIYPDFQRSDLTLLADWDDGSGFSLLSQSVEGDRFLSQLYADLRPDPAPAQD